MAPRDTTAQYAYAHRAGRPRPIVYAQQTQPPIVPNATAPAYHSVYIPTSREAITTPTDYRPARLPPIHALSSTSSLPQPSPVSTSTNPRRLPPPKGGWDQARPQPHYGHMPAYASLRDLGDGKPGGWPPQIDKASGYDYAADWNAYQSTLEQVSPVGDTGPERIRRAETLAVPSPRITLPPSSSFGLGDTPTGGSSQTRYYSGIRPVTSRSGTAGISNDAPQRTDSFVSSPTLQRLGPTRRPIHWLDRP